MIKVEDKYFISLKILSSELLKLIYHKQKNPIIIPINWEIKVARDI